MKKPNPAKDHYRRLRHLSCETLWFEEVPEFDHAAGSARLDRVAVVRAVGVVFSESGTPAQIALAREWLTGLLSDPEEKIRRYAMSALPKLAEGPVGESSLLGLFETSPSAREKSHVQKTLAKIGGDAALEAANEGRFDPGLVRRLQANVARNQSPGTIRLEERIADFVRLQIRFHCREGLEDFLIGEIADDSKLAARFRVVDRATGLVIVEPQAALSLSELYSLRCFSAVGFAPRAPTDSPPGLESIASAIASLQGILQILTDGAVRYRLEFPDQGHQRDAANNVADRVYELAPMLLNDPRSALWQFNISGDSGSLEFTPRLRPDPRFAYRKRDVPAASHPPLAASMARLAGLQPDEVVWDPFVGSGVELIECGLRGNGIKLIGTDLSPEAIVIARENLIAAGCRAIPLTLECIDFRDYTRVEGLERGSVSLVITNPPMGRRVPVSDLREVIQSLFGAACAVLRPGGRLVFVNPLPLEPRSLPLKLEFRRKVDLGAFYCHLEKYVRLAD